MKAHPSIEQNETSLRECLSNSADFKTNDVEGSEERYRIFYLETMVDLTIIQEHLIRPLLQMKSGNIHKTISILDFTETDLLSDASKAIANGKTVVQKEGEATFYLLGTELVKERSVTIPLTERTLRGAHRAMNENLDTNLNLVRQIVSSPDLVVKYYTMGRRSNTKVAIIYLRSLANELVLQEFERRIECIDIDYIDAPGFVQELIEEKQFSLFPKMLISERPDRVRSYLFDGKLAILTDGSPDCIILPVSFWSFFQSPDDYRIGWLFGSALRFLRIVSFVIGMHLPGFYISLVTRLASEEN